MHESPNSMAAEVVTADASAPQAPRSRGRVLLAALVSAFLPGAGQLLLGKRTGGLLLLSVFAVFWIAYCILRLPQNIYAVMAATLVNLLLVTLAALDAGYSPTSGKTKLRSGWLALLLPAALLSTVFHDNWQLRAAGFGVFLDPSRSMSPTVPEGGRVMVDLRHYRDTPPQRGEIIVGMSPPHPGIYIIKRVIAVAGDNIEVQGDGVIVNGKKMDESYVLLDGPLPDEIRNFGPITLPANKLFVMGDNRHVSLDSRSEQFGLMDVSAVRGRVIFQVPSGRNLLP